MATQPERPDWYRDHFNQDYLKLYAGRTREQAKAECDFVVDRLRVVPEDRLLDLCCGFGRHLEAFLQRGFDAWGLDLSADLLRASGDAVGSRVVRADMRALPFDGAAAPFTVVTSFFTSFGYFPTERENRRVPEEIARVLAPSGRFCLDLIHPEPTIRSLVPRTERSVEGLSILEERSYDPERRRIEKRIRLRDPSSRRTREYLESVRVYSPQEIASILESTGLEIDAISGSFDGEPLGDGSPRMVITGHRRPA